MISRTALITATFVPPTSVNVTVTSLGPAASSAAAAGAATAAAADHARHLRLRRLMI